MNIDKLNDSIFSEKTDVERAARFLQLHGFRVLHSDFETGFGKIDLMVTDERLLIAIIIQNVKEVQPFESLSRRVLKLSKAVAAYSKRFRLSDVEVRLDLLSIDNAAKKITHKQNAFDCYLNY